MADDSVKVSIDVATQAAEIALKKFQEETKKADGFWNVFKGNLAAQFSYSAITGAISSIKGFVAETIQLSLKTEQALKNMSVALVGAGIASKSSIDDLTAYTDQIEKTTAFSQEAAAESIGLLASLTSLDKEGLKTATTAAADLAATLNLDLNTATQLIAKGINGNTTAFQRYGIEVRKGANEIENFSNIVVALGKFQGNAVKQTETFSGALTKLNNAQDDLYKSIGSLITQNSIVIAGMQKVTDVFISLADWVKENSENIQIFVTSMAAAATVVGTAYAAILAFGAGIGGLATSFTVLSTAASVAWAAITGPIGIAVAAITGLGVAIFAVVKYWDDIKIATYEATAAVLEYGAKAAGVFSDKTKNVLLGEAQALRDKVQATKDAQAAEEAAKAKKAEQEAQAERIAQAEKKRAAEQKQRLQDNADFTDKLIKQSQDRNKAAEEELALKQQYTQLEQDLLTAQLEQNLITYDEYQMRRDEIDLAYNEQRLALIESQYQADAERIQSAYDAGLVSQEGYNNARLELERKYQNEKSKAQLDIAKKDQANDKKDAETRKRLQQERLAQTSQMFGALADLAATGGERMFKVSQAFNYAEATTAGILAIQKAASAAPFPANLPGIITETARMASSLVRIKQTKPSFAEGGVVGGFNGASLGPDNTTANVRTGEMILTAAQQRNLFEMANTGTAGTASNIEQLLGRLIIAVETQPVIVNIGGRTVVETVRSELEAGRTFA